MRKNPKGGLSAGSILMLLLTATVLLFSVILLIHLSSGKTADFSALRMQVLALGSDTPEAGENGGENVSTGMATAVISSAGIPELTSVPETHQPENLASQATVTIAGRLAIEKAIRQSCYLSDTKLYDFTELLTLLKPEISGDINISFLENLMTDQFKVSGLVVPSCAADLLQDCRFDLCLCGFPKVWDKKEDGAKQTVQTLKEREIQPLGLFTSETEDHFVVRNANGIRIGFMQYAADLSSATRKSLTKAGMEWAVPQADTVEIASDIAHARAAGAEVIIVFLHWGKSGEKIPSKSQLTLAQQIADLGADAIIGAGSGIAQRTENLTASDGRSVLCAYSLGTLMSDDRSSASKIGGYMLHLTFDKDSDGVVTMRPTTYTPTYVWRYRQDSMYYYKCMAADQVPPDGMDSEQIGVMEKTLAFVENTLEGSPLKRR